MSRPRPLLVLVLLSLLAGLPCYADGGTDAALDGSQDATDASDLEGGVADAGPDLLQIPPTELLGHHGLVVALDHAEGDTLYLYDLSKGELTRLSDEIACRGPDISPDGQRVVYHRAGMLYQRELAGGRAQPIVAGYDGFYWLDEEGEEWIYYTTIGDDPTDLWRRLEWPWGQGITTRRRRLRDGHDEHMLDWKGSGGPSPDGTHIAAGYATVAIFDLAGEPHFLNGGEQGCNTSLSPDARYLLMFFPDVDHRRIGVVNKDDRLLWQLRPPLGVTRWDNPDWSNHPRFATVSGVASHGYASIYVIELPARFEGRVDAPVRLLQLLDARQGNHDWREPTLWVDWRGAPLPEPAFDAGEPRDAATRAAVDGGALDAGREVAKSGDGCGVGDSATSRAWPLVLLLVCLSWWARR